jgi:hypothetical protein
MDCIMNKQDEYRQNAEYAQQMAIHAAMPEDRASWLRVAAGWLSLLQRKKAAGNGHEQRDRFEGQAREADPTHKDAGTTH